MTASCFSEFYLKTTDRQIDLMALNRSQGAGFEIVAYTPGRLNFKGGGVWQDSPIAAGRRPVFGVRGNVADALTLRIAATSHDSIAQYQQSLDEMLEQAMAYWLSDTGIDPVWIVAKANGDSDRRYAIVYGYSLDEYADPYHEPFLGSGPGYVLDDLVLGLERSAWQHLPPFEMEEVELYNLRAPGGATKPIAPTTGGVTVVPDYAIDEDLELYTYDASTTTYAQILSYPAGMFPASFAAGDILYVRSSIPNNFHPVTGIYWEVSATGDNPTEYAWEYYNGSSWVELPSVRGGEIHSYSGTFAGVVRWLTPGDMSVVAPDAGAGLSDAYFIRLRVISGSGTSHQITSRPYRPIQPYVQFNADQVGGDLDALTMISLSLDGYSLSGATPLIGAEYGRVICGLRSLSRDGPDGGPVFSAYLPCREFTPSLPAGVTIDDSHSQLTTPPQNIILPYGNAGQAIRLLGNAADTEIVEAFRVVIDETASPYYQGTFRLFMRVQAGETDPYTAAVQFRYRLTMIDPFDPTMVTDPISTLIGPTIDMELVNPSTENNWQLVDLGRIQIPPIDHAPTNEQLFEICIIIETKIEDSKVVHVNDVILMPVDEWAADSSANSNIYNIFEYDEDHLKTWQIDSIGNPREHIRSVLFSRLDPPGSELMIGALPVIANREAAIHPGKDQRIWFLFESNGIDTSTQRPLPTLLNWALRVRLYKLQRYHFLRSDD